MEDRFYSGRYSVNRPAKSRRKEKYWIYLTIACMLLLLTGIVILVIFLVPKHKLPHSGMSTKIRQMAEEEMNRFGRRTTPKSLLPSRDFDIDPRSDFYADDEEVTQPESEELALTVLSHASTQAGLHSRQSSSLPLPLTVEISTTRPNSFISTLLPVRISTTSTKIMDNLPTSSPQLLTRTNGRFNKTFTW